MPNHGHTKVEKRETNIRYFDEILIQAK